MIKNKKKIQEKGQKDIEQLDKMNQLEINKVQKEIEKKIILEEQKRKKNYEENQKQILQIKDKICENQRIHEDNISKLEMERIKEEQII